MRNWGIEDFKSAPLGATDYRQVMEHAVRNPCKEDLPKESERRRCDRKILCRAFSTFISSCHECRGSVLCTPPPAWELPSLRDYLESQKFKTSEPQKFLRFWIFWDSEFFEILNFWDSEFFEILNFLRFWIFEILNFLRFWIFEILNFLCTLNSSTPQLLNSSYPQSLIPLIYHHLFPCRAAVAPVTD